jgi:hypothetical protein
MDLHLRRRSDRRIIPEERRCQRVKHRTSIPAILAIAAVSLLALGCGQKTIPETISFTGQIVYVDLEGGFWGIIADSRTPYEPLNLPKDYQNEGQRVAVTARICHDCVSIHMWGEIIEILEIHGTD